MRDNDDRSAERRIRRQRTLKTLATYRSVPGGVIFDENLLSENARGVVRIGDEIEVMERK